MPFGKNSFHGQKKSFDGDLNDFNVNTHSKSMIVYESWLNKKGSFHKAWKERYFVVYTDRKLVYYEFENSTIPQGWVDLKDVTGIDVYLPQILDHKSKHYKSSSDGLIDLDQSEYKTEFDSNVMSKKHQRTSSFKLKRLSLKGINNIFGFELITPQRTYIFSTKNVLHFHEWLNALRLLSFGKALYKGYLRKNGGKKGNHWTRRYFIFYDNNEIRYFVDDTLNKQKGKIELNTVIKIEISPTNKYHYPYCMELITKDRVWVLVGDTLKVRDMWLRAIKTVMQKFIIKFVPSHKGYFLLYNNTIKRFIKYYVAFFNDNDGNLLFFFENQIQCKQLEAITSYGQERFKLVCKTKTKRIISLKQLINVSNIQPKEFQSIHGECKSDIKLIKNLLHIKLDDDDINENQNNFYLSSEYNNIIKWNLKSSEKQNIFAQLSLLGYRSCDIIYALSEYEKKNFFNEKVYKYDDIKSIIDNKINILKPKQEKIKQQNMNQNGLNNMSLKPLFEGNNNNNNNNNEINASYSPIVNENNANNWNVTDVIQWFKIFQNGSISTKYPKVLKEIYNLNIDGKKIKTLNDLNLQQLGVGDPLSRALLLESISKFN